MNCLLKVVFVILFCKLTDAEFLNKEKYALIETLGNSLGVKNFVFVQSNREIDILKELKSNFLSKFYSVFYNSKTLDHMLSRSTATKYFERKTFIITKENLNFSRLIEKVSGATLVYWLVFTDTLKNLRPNYIPMNADLFAVQFYSEKVAIDKLYHSRRGKNLTKKTLGVWPRHFNNGYVPSLLLPKKIDFINFERLPLRVLVYWNKHFCSAAGPKLALDRMECFQHEMIEITSKKLNFAINKLECPERLYPYNYPNGTLSELFNMLRREEVDLSTASYVIDVNRLDSYDFAWPTFTTRSMMYIKLHGHSLHWTAYLRPLNTKLWLAIGFWIVAAGLLNQIFKLIRTQKPKCWKFLVLKTIKSIFETLQMFCNQGIHSLPQWCSNRLVYLSTFFISLTIYQGYSGHLISSLTVVMPQIPFNDLNSFFKVKTHKLMTLRTGFHHYYLQKILDHEGITELMLDSEELPFYTDQGIAKLCEEDNLAFVEFRENLVQHDLPCKITEIPSPMLYQSIGIGFPKNSPYQEFIKRELTVLHSTGILQRMRTLLYSYVKLEEKDRSSEDYLAVTFEQVTPLFFLLCLGFFLSFIIFILEILYYSFFC